MEAKTIKEEQQRDHALYFVEDGEEGFSPEHNKFIIEKTIKKHKLMMQRRKKAYEESVRERADAVATYLKSSAAQKDTPVEKYFGKKWMAYLRGEKIVEQLKGTLFGRQRNIYIPGN
jgi:glutathione synthase/RimK-type ligase-like ATP-grasp enzyme